MATLHRFTSIQVPPARLKRAGGFTLLELIVVVTLLGLITAAVVPLYGRSMSAVQARSLRNDMVSLIGFVQSKAVSESVEYRIYFDEKRQVYWVMRFDGFDEDNEKTFAAVEAEFGRETALPRNYVFDRIDAHEDRQMHAPYIACFPNGSCDRATIKLKNVRERNRSVSLETLGAMGKFKIDEPGVRR